MKDIVKEFKAFILRGNVVDLAIAVVIGVAFGGIVTALVNDIISPLLSVFGGKPNFSNIWILTVNHAQFKFGDFITVILNFLILAAIIYFLIIRPLNWLMAHKKREMPADPTTRACPYCVSEIPLAATRCAFCTQEVPAVELVAVAAE